MPYPRFIAYWLHCSLVISISNSDISFSSFVEAKKEFSLWILAESKTHSLVVKKVNLSTISLDFSSASLNWIAFYFDFFEPNTFEK